MKTKLFSILFTLPLILSFISCGDDLPEGLDPLPPNNGGSGKTDTELATSVVGDYSGQCTINFGNGIKNETSYPVSFFKDSQAPSSAVLYMTLGDGMSLKQDGLGRVGNIKATGFSNTTGSEISFNVTNIELSYGSNDAPEFITKDCNPGFDIAKVEMKLSCTSNGIKYDPTKNSMTFIYSGELQITGKKAIESKSLGISYTFNLSKKQL